MRVLGAHDDRLFPGGAALRVGQVVHLIEDDTAHAPRRGGGLQEHVAQHFGGHHQDIAAGVLDDVARKQAHLLAVLRAQVTELLVGQRLDRRGVHDLETLACGPEHPELGHHGLAGARWRGHHDAVTRRQVCDSLLLEGVEGEGIAGAELFYECGIAGRWAMDGGRWPRFLRLWALGFGLWTCFRHGITLVGRILQLCRVRKIRATFAKGA